MVLCVVAMRKRTVPDAALFHSAWVLQVLFCSLTSHQLGLYRAYLSSGEVEAILAGRRQVGSTCWARCYRLLRRGSTRSDEAGNRD